MDKSEKILQAFRNKFDNMTHEERKQYMQKMGLKYQKSTRLTEAKSAVKIHVPITEIKHVHPRVFPASQLYVADENFTYVSSNGKRSAKKATKYRASTKQPVLSARLKK